MLTCRSIPEETWRHVRKALVFYFAHRGLRGDAEDLAQQTILTLHKREDFEFAEEEDFLKVCYGFARRILCEGYRAAKKQRASGELDDDLPSPSHQSGGARAIEAGIMLKEVLQTGGNDLEEEDWLLILQQVLDMDGPKAREPSAQEGSRLRVALHRARNRLKKLTGW